MKVLILTCFQDLNPGYSLSGIASDQTLMLSKYKNDVFFCVCDHYNPEFEKENPIYGTLIKGTLFSHLIDYVSKKDLTPDHASFVEKQALKWIEIINEYKIDLIFTHDLIFTGWSLPYALAIKKVSEILPKMRWLHWIHSVPSTNRDWWDIKWYGEKHKIVFPNAAARMRVAEQYKGSLNDVRVIPHIKDMRTYYDFHSDTIQFIADFPAIMQSYFVQIYPAGTDRLLAKGVDKVAWIFGHIKRLGYSVCLVIANQWATGRQRKQDVEEFYRKAKEEGLERDVDFIFTSEWNGGKYDKGLPRRILRELQLMSNLFIFPTKEESFGLVGPEAAFASCLPVLNRSLDAMPYVFGGNGLYFDFGSHHCIHNVDNPDAYYRTIASIIVGRFKQHEALMTKTYFRRNLNYDTLYRLNYESVMAESLMW